MRKYTIDEVMTFDPIDILKLEYGSTDWSKFTDSEFKRAFTMVKTVSEIKKNTLKQAGDTYASMKWDEFKSLIENHGFKCALRYDFLLNSMEEAVIYYDENGFIIWATSCFGKSSLNGGNLYGQIKEGYSFKNAYIPKNCNYSRFARGKWQFDIDVREGLLYTLNNILQNAKPLKIWEDDSFLWFADYAESKKEGFNYAEVTKAKINSSPDLKRILGIYLNA